jgi:hypothetical protein
VHRVRYNAVNGVPSCANLDIMTTKARDEWGFYGYITSDCGAVDCVINDHHYTSTPDAHLLPCAHTVVIAPGHLLGHLSLSLSLSLSFSLFLSLSLSLPPSLPPSFPRTRALTHHTLLLAHCLFSPVPISQHSLPSDESVRATAAVQDIECGGYFSSHLGPAVADGAVSMDSIDAALTHLFMVQVGCLLFCARVV